MIPLRAPFCQAALLALIASAPAAAQTKPPATADGFKISGSFRLRAET